MVVGYMRLFQSQAKRELIHNITNISRKENKLGKLKFIKE